MPKTLLLSPHADTYERLLAPARLEGLELKGFASWQEALPHCGEAQILFGAPDQVVPLLPHCPQLRWVQSSWAGVTPLVCAERRDYLLTGVKGIFGPLMSEYVMGWVLAHQRKILVRASRRHWDDRPDEPLAGRRLGIMGTGSIGAHVANTCRHFGLTVRGLNTSGAAVPGFSDCYAVADIDAFADGLDFLVALLPDTPATSGLVNARSLSRLRPGALFINAGRANAVVQDDLLAALAANTLAAAVLDVFKEEPLPEDSPLWRVDRLYITSHTAAPTLAKDIVGIFCENYKRYMAGEPLLYPVDFQRGY